MFHSVVKFLQSERARVESNQVTGATLQNSAKAMKLFCEMADVPFITKVGDFENDGLLTSEQTDELRQQAQTIQDSIGCNAGNTLSTQDRGAVYR